MKPIDYNHFQLETSKSDIPIYTRGNPSFDSLEKWEREALINPLLEVIKEFYKDPENRRKFEKWKAEKYKQNALRMQSIFSIQFLYLAVYSSIFGELLLALSEAYSLHCM